MIIMLAGGRACVSLSPETIERVKQAHIDGAEFLVGDCYGADLLFQKLLLWLNAKATVYHIGNGPRNNAGFPTRHVSGNRYTDKDNVMRAISDSIIYEPQGAGPGTMASVSKLKQYE